MAQDLNEADKMDDDDHERNDELDNTQSDRNSRSVSSISITGFEIGFKGQSVRHFTASVITSTGNVLTAAFGLLEPRKKHSI